MVIALDVQAKLIFAHGDFVPVLRLSVTVRYRKSN